MSTTSPLRSTPCSSTPRWDRCASSPPTCPQPSSPAGWRPGRVPPWPGSVRSRPSCPGSASAPPRSPRRKRTTGSPSRRGPRTRCCAGSCRATSPPALPPSNVPLLNPASAKAAIDTAGLNFVRGALNLVRDIARAPRVPQMVDRSGFTIGENLAATPGAVVLRTELFELIQYAPQTPTVRRVPLLLVPPTINKFYVLDLAPDRSWIEYLVRSGQQVFAMSWRNPDARHAGWGVDAYVQAVLDAVDAVERISAADRTVLTGVCSGGILAGIAAAH